MSTQPSPAVLRISKTVTPGPNQHNTISQALADEEDEEDAQLLDDIIQDEDHVRFRYLADVSVYANLEPFE